MSQLERLVEQAMPKHTLATYVARGEAAVRVLARMCNVDPDLHVRQFDLIRERLGKHIDTPQSRTSEALQADPVLAITRRIMGTLPAIVEMVLTLAGDGPRGFAYLTQGSASSTLSDALVALLRGTLQLHLESGGSDPQAELVADVFRTVFPNLRSLKDFSAMAQGLLVGVVPRGERLELKLYFNTRLDTSVPHRDKIMQVLALCGFADEAHNGRIYDALYQTNERARFNGVGIDLADEDGRVKMYVHTPRATTIEFLEDLVQRGIAEGDLTHARQLLASTQSDASSSECEVAFALRGHGPTTLKVTTFFHGKTVRAADGDMVLSLLQTWGYPTDPIRELFASLDAENSVLQCFPLHGVGVELTDATRPKVNLYVQPNI